MKSYDLLYGVNHYVINVNYSRRVLSLSYSQFDRSSRKWIRCYKGKSDSCSSFTFKQRLDYLDKLEQGLLDFDAAFFCFLQIFPDFDY